MADDRLCANMACATVACGAVACAAVSCVAVVQGPYYCLFINARIIYKLSTVVRGAQILGLLIQFFVFLFFVLGSCGRALLGPDSPAAGGRQGAFILRHTTRVVAYH